MISGKFSKCISCFGTHSFLLSPLSAPKRVRTWVGVVCGKKRKFVELALRKRLDDIDASGKENDKVAWKDPLNN